MLGRLFGKKSLDELKAEADRSFEAKRWGEAKLAYDRLEERAAKENAELAAWARGRVTSCCDAIADERIAHAKDMAQHGHVDLAREELAHALDTARSDEALARVRAAQRDIEQRDAIEHAEPVAELSDEERMTLIAGAWEPLQAEELEAYGEPLMRAVLAIEDGRGKAALDLLMPMLERAKEASYLWLEIGRARLVADDVVGASEALRTFLSRIGPEEGGAARMMAHRELARMAHDRGDRDAAVAELEACAAALEDDPRPYLDLGNYLRLIGRPSEAIEVLEICGSLFPDGAVEWPVTMELGLACADAGDSKRAIDALESVLETLAARGHLDFPPPAVVALAKLHEAGGNLARAADLYRALTEGSDGANHGLYHSEAARLLEALGMHDEAQRMRERAAALPPAPTEPS